MAELSRTETPLWARIIFETPEYAKELLSVGSFPVIRSNVIDISNYILIFGEKKSTLFPKLYLIIKAGIILFLEWINNHWKKGL